jgi:hypothetical protein
MKRMAPSVTLVAALVMAAPVWARPPAAKGHTIARTPRPKPAPPSPSPSPSPALLADDSAAAAALTAPVVAPAPAPAEQAPHAAPAPPPPVEKTRSGAPGVEALRAQYEALKDELYRSRARRETLESALLSTQLLPVIRWDGGRHHIVTRAEVRLDGVRLWESTDGLVSDKPVDLAARSAPPGPHMLGVRVEVRSRDDAKLGYVSDQSFTVVLPEGKKTRVEITVDESGSAPSYNPEIEIDVASK